MAIDTGTWTAHFLPSPHHKVVINSSDFTHDVQLVLTGDFGSEKEKREYVDDLINRLNRTRDVDFS